MSDQPSEPIRLAKVEDIPEGSGREFRIGKRFIAVFRHQGTFYALEDVCPHAGAPLSNGPIGGGAVTCLWHAWRFDLRNGRCLNIQKAPPVPTYAVTIQGDDVYVTLPASDAEEG